MEGEIFNDFTKIQIDLLNVERNKLESMHRSGSVNEEIFRKIEKELDLEERGCGWRCMRSRSEF